MGFDETIFKKVFLNLTLSRFNNLYRPDSYPYLSGDSLRKYADHVYDETSKLNTRKVRTNDIIFLKTDYLEEYFLSTHKNIKNPYILITHNSDISIKEKELRYLDKKIIHWFAMGLETKMNERVSSIPIGLENKRYLRNGITKNFNNVLNSKNFNATKKQKKILCSFNEKTNYEVRNPIIKISNENNEIDVKNFNSSLDYLTELSKYKYILCPEGNSIATHRMWESLIFNCTPVVVDNFFHQNFFDLGIPLIILDDWSDLKDVTFEEIEELNKVNSGKNFKEFIYFKFWEKRITSKKI